MSDRHKRNGLVYDEHADRAFFWGAIWGGLIGAAVAAWNSRQSGKALRERLMGRGQEIIDDMEQAASNVRRQIEGESIQESLAVGKAEARRLNDARRVG